MKNTVDFIVLAIIYLFIFYRKWKAEGKDILFINTLMYIYLSFVLYFTLMPVITSLPFVFNHSYVPMNLVPFIDVSYGRGDFIRQIVLNVIMTIPFGFLLPLIKSKTSLIKLMLYTFLLSLGIELLQPLVSDFRSSDITDLITNVFGGVLGYILYFLFRPLTAKILCYIKNE
ncbi:VanZ family protein [Mediterraneibacter glycyrrhizinilyticus]|uniref:VanZ family protein n=1 Tax=Mediterraneibacter glycyrrhizinilyticus TaxID=342942 RepID=UPI0025AAEE3D|nr:VanZ family protein [Mediterraneibacter glycyrrhizinilyticus]MDN0043010.1 VanZ family protein [Mediterraneibacter glycyrrhizinilyticus]